MRAGFAARVPMVLRSRTRASTRRGLSTALALIVLSGCGEPEPLYYTDFMEDRFAREGTLARCNENREASVNDIECANARRAAATIALREERARRAQLEQESERKLAEMRAEMERQRQAAIEAQAIAEAAARAAYEAQWREGGQEQPVGVDGEPLIDTDPAGEIPARDGSPDGFPTAQPAAE